MLGNVEEKRFVNAAETLGEMIGRWCPETSGIARYDVVQGMIKGRNNRCRTVLYVIRIKLKTIRRSRNSKYKR